MNVLKNMEAIFLVSAALLLATSYATAAAHDATALRGAAIKTTVVDGVTMPVVTISAKRLSAAEKAAL